MNNHHLSNRKYYRVFIAFMLYTLVLGLHTLFAQSTPSYKRYNVQSCIVEYSLGGSQKGSETLYFDRWGMREARYSNKELSMMGVQQKTNTLLITDYDWMYNIDLDKKTGTKTKNGIFQSLLKNAKNNDLIEAGMKMMKDMGGEKIGTEMVAGKTCDIWEIQKLGSKTWICIAVPLKVAAKFAGVEITSVATKVQEGATIPESKFKVPAGVKVKEGKIGGSISKKLKISKDQ